MKKMLLPFLALILLAGVCLSAATVIRAEELDDFSFIGADVIVYTIKEMEQLKNNQPISGRKGKIIEIKTEGYILFNEKGAIERESRVLPDDYTEWNVSMGEKFPGKGIKIAMPGKNPIIKLEDGEIISGLQSYWKLADEVLHKKLQERISRELKKLQKILLQAQ